MHRALGVALLVLLAFVCSGCTTTSVQPQAPSTEPTVGFQKGNLAPDFHFEKPDGQTVSMSDFRGNVVMLNFWATWCGPCRFEMSSIQALYEDDRWSEKGLKVLTVNSGESPSKVETFMKENGLSFPVLLDVRSDITQAYNVRALPTTFFIDENGVIGEIKIGAFLNKSEIELVLNRLIE
jgi:peroxiredoxin